MGYFVDYLRFTIKIDTDRSGIALQNFKKYIKLEIEDEEWKLLKGLDGYKQGIYFPCGIKILFDGMPGMGIHIIMPGLSLLSPHLDFDIHTLIENLKADKMPYNISRVDIALDTEINFSYFYSKFRRKQFACRYSLKNCKQYTDAYGRGTLYFGKRGGLTMFRIYDKALEQGITDKIWTRIEMECKDEACEQIINALKEGTVKNYFLGHLRFVEKRCEKMERAVTSKKFLEALENPTERVRVQTKKSDKTLEWFETQVAPTLKAIIRDMGAEYVADIIAKSKISKTQVKKRFNLKVVKSSNIIINQSGTMIDIGYNMVDEESGEINNGEVISKQSYIQMCMNDLPKVSNI